MDYVRAARARIAPHDSVERFRGLGVDVHLTGGRLRTAHEVTLGDTGRAIWGRHIVLATGSRPLVPDLPGLREAGYLTNETVLTVRRAAALTTIAGFAVLVASLPSARDAVALLASGDVATVRDWLLSFGVWAPVASVALMLLQSLVAPLPSSPVTYANGLIFGLWWGTLLSWASALAAAAIAFGLSRTFGRPFAERLLTRAALAWSDAFFARWGGWAVLVGRLMPVVSFDVVSYGAGLTPMRPSIFLLATGVGMIPGTVLYVWLGQLGSRSGAALLWTLTALAALGAVVIALKPAAARWLAERRR